MKMKIEEKLKLQNLLKIIEIESKLAIIEVLELPNSGHMATFRI